MEAVPRLPMISFDLKTSPEPTQFGPQLKLYIASFYNEDPESYTSEISNLESLRSAAVRPSTDVAGCQMLNKYYCQLHFLKSRFPMEENQDAAAYFTWKDGYTNVPCGLADIRFELACVLYNIGALRTQLAAADPRTTPDGMKMACSHFQCAAWAFDTIKTQYYQFIPYVSSLEFLQYMQQVCLAQAQECILEKSMMDNRKATIISKIAVQVVDYYKRALSLLTAAGEDGGIKDLVGSKIYKEWHKYVTFKIAYHKCIALLYQGQQAEEQQKMGERVAFYQAACEQLDEARKLAASLKQQQDVAEALAFTSDVVEGKRKAAKNENEFIYHEEVPDKNSLQEVKGASLVKGIPFNINDSEVSGPDIFARLVPMEAHEASSLYSEKKAQMLRSLGEMVEAKDQALVEFMSSLHLEVFTQMRQATGLSQELVDRAAALSARPTATQDLVNAMGKLANSYHEVEAMLAEIQELLQEEEKNEKEYQNLMGKRPPSIIATDLAREAAKYREAHSKANESNENLHKAMTAHVANLKILMKPLSELQKQIPSVEFPNAYIDESCVKEIEHLTSKVEEMRNQRAMLWSQFREALHQDDITAVLVTRQNQPLDEVFQQELKKHQEIASLMEQNCAAQENILKAFVEAYARSTQTRRYLQDVITKRNATVTALIGSFDTYEDLVAKAAKGIEFYEKLESNVAKLLQRIRGACKVQQEEREQFMSKSNAVKEPEASVTTPQAPKLKDFLEARKRGTYYPQENVNVWPTTVRPAPLGSEVNEVALPQVQESQQINQGLADRFANMNTKQGFSDKQAATNVTDSYHTISSSSQNAQTAHGYAYPYVAQTGQASCNNQYCVNEYATSVHPNIVSTNYNSTYSSPTIEMKSSQSGQLDYQPQYNSEATEQTNQNYGYGVNTNQVPNVPYGHTQQVQNPSYGNTQNVQNPSYVYNENHGTNYGYSAQYPTSVQGYGTAQVDSGSQNIYGYAQQTPSTAASNNPLGYNNTTQMVPPSTASESMAYGYGTASSGYNSSATPQPQNASYGQNIPGYSGAQSVLQPGTENTYGYGSTTQPVSSVYQNPYGYDTSQYPANQPTVIESQAVPSANQSVHMEYPTGNQYGYGYNSSQTVDPNIPTYGYPQSQPYYGYDASQQAVPNVHNYPGVSAGTSSGQNYQQIQTNVINDQTIPTRTSSSNLDLLTGLDFSVNQAPLVPQPKEAIPVTDKQTKNVKNNNIETTTVSKIETPPPLERVVNRKPLNNLDVKKLFTQELEKYEKSVDELNVKANLDAKWKQIHESDKKAISVARCYPLKNRYPDILPYDQTRVELTGTKDDYINASHVKNVSYYSPSFILTQSPLQATFGDFWTMVREQHVELVLCLQSDQELGSDVYFPTQKGQDLTFNGLVISLVSATEKPSWIERIVTVSEKKDARPVIHLQFTAWPGSLFPKSVDGFVAYVSEALHLYMQQRSTSHPILVHCASGIGRSGVASLLISAILEVTSNPVAIPELVQLATKMCECRKNVLRDREHLKFAYEALLGYMQQLTQGPSKVLKEVKPASQPEQKPSELETKQPVDPLSALDPYWANKRGA